ncbi:hypothetical protein PHMEG_00017803 [Phytophthora megakarya]|uniref:Reverse transcriptase n=1 Tax=Phytophthora megakarya TaxID=4795 RepID=A0A225VX60_9STRA|nr:hypothetical protein PHMEG_00017803 [Phytophthora megakarya]
MAEYSGMNRGVQAALNRGATGLVIVGDSRLAIHQSLGVIACKKDSLMTQHNHHKKMVGGLKSVKYLHVVREYNAAAYSLATEALEKKASATTTSEAKLSELSSLNRISEVIYEPPNETLESEPSEERRVTGSTPASPNAGDVDPLKIQKERRRRIAVAQDEELRWANLKAVLRGDESVLTYRAVRDAWKIADHFVLSEDDVLYHLGTRLLRSDHLQEEPTLRLVVPTTMIQEVLQNCHYSLEGGHQGIARTFYRVKFDYYWVGLYADVARHVRSCPDCSSSK